MVARSPSPTRQLLERGRGPAHPSVCSALPPTAVGLLAQQRLDGVALQLLGELLVALRHDPQRRPGHQQGWGNVMYIPAAPWCPRNERYARSVAAAFRSGSSPSVFPAEHYERAWPNRFTVDDLNATGRRGLGLD